MDTMIFFGSSKKIKKIIRGKKPNGGKIKMAAEYDLFIAQSIFMQIWIRNLLLSSENIYI
jgi:hypothetical protein